MKIDARKGFILNLIILNTLPADKALLAYQPYTSSKRLLVFNTSHEVLPENHDQEIFCMVITLLNSQQILMGLQRILQIALEKVHHK